MLEILRIMYELHRKMSKWLLMHELGWKPIPYKLRICDTNSSIMSSSDM